MYFYVIDQHYKHHSATAFSLKSWTHNGEIVLPKKSKTFTSLWIERIANGQSIRVCLTNLNVCTYNDCPLAPQRYSYIVVALPCEFHGRQMIKYLRKALEYLLHYKVHSHLLQYSNMSYTTDVCYLTSIYNYIIWWTLINFYND